MLKVEMQIPTKTDRTQTIRKTQVTRHHFLSYFFSVRLNSLQSIGATFRGSGQNLTSDFKKTKERLPQTEKNSDKRTKESDLRISSFKFSSKSHISWIIKTIYIWPSPLNSLNSLNFYHFFYLLSYATFIISCYIVIDQVLSLSASLILYLIFTLSRVCGLSSSLSLSLALSLHLHFTLSLTLGNNRRARQIGPTHALWARIKNPEGVHSSIHSFARTAHLLACLLAHFAQSLTHGKVND